MVSKLYQARPRPGTHRSAVMLVVLLAVTVLMLSLADRSAFSGQTQAEMNIQAGRDYEKSDAALNQTYKRLMGRLGNRARTKLKAAQLAWLKYRDAEAEFRAVDSEGGSIHPLAVVEAKRQLTERRTQELATAAKP